MLERRTGDIISQLLSTSRRQPTTSVGMRLQTQRDAPGKILGNAINRRQDAARAAKMVIPGSEENWELKSGVGPVGEGSPAPTGGGGSYEDQFNEKLMKMIAASGGKLKITSGKRSSQKQAELYAKAVKKYGKANAGKWAAPPGRSDHEFGLAADLRGDLKWAHANAAKFGLAFPMSHEPWHVGLPNAKALRGKMAPGHSHGDGHNHGPAPKGGGSRAKSTGNPHLDYIINNESRFDPFAKNPTSSAFGIGQMIKANRVAYGKRLGFNPDTTNGMEQIAMMMEYIKDRYGTPEAAAAFKRKRGWY